MVAMSTTTRTVTLLQWALIFSSLFLAACNNTKFKSESPKTVEPTALVPEEKTLQLTCDPTSNVANLVTDVVSEGETSVRLKGEFCNVQKENLSGDLTVLFALDFSGSMDFNDPVIGATCGRLKAAEAIATKMDEFVAKGVNVKFAIQAFGDTATTITAPMDAATFKAQLLGNNFCRSDIGATNYEASFIAAKTLLTNQTGIKLVYFISDGMPTVSNASLNNFNGDVNEVYSSGLSAAQDLRTLDKLTLNAIYIQNQNNIASPSSGVQDPQTYLEQITGSKENVRLVSNADQVDASILSFATPEVSTLEQGSVVGKLDAGSLGSGNVELESLQADPSRTGVWTFVTKPFALYGQIGQVVENKVSLTIKDSDGKDVSATATIKYQIQK